MKVGTHTVFGMLALRTLAGLKWLRVRGSRYAVEQTMIEKWLAGVVDGSRRDWRLGHEIALCGRLIKGYGATNERGKENLLHVLEHLAHGASVEASAEAVEAAREAALADDAGKALDVALLAWRARATGQGAADPVRAQTQNPESANTGMKTNKNGDKHEAFPSPPHPCRCPALHGLAAPSFAQTWPSKPVSVVVNFPPGGAADQLARAIGIPLQEALGQPVVVENRAGAGGNIGGEAVAKSPADGYIIATRCSSALSVRSV